MNIQTIQQPICCSLFSVLYTASLVKASSGQEYLGGGGGGKA